MNQPQEERPNDENAQLWTEEARKEYDEWCKEQDQLLDRFIFNQRGKKNGNDS